jgi:hypothetical protein
MEQEELKRNLRQYIALKGEIKLLGGRESELKARLTKVLDDVEPNENGHRVLKVEDSDTGEVTMTRQRRVSKTLDIDKAAEILDAKGIKEECIKLIPTLDEDAIMTAFYNGKITEEDIDAMFPTKVSYAFLVDNK